MAKVNLGPTRKHHALAHCIHSMGVENIPAVNPWMGCCWMEETFIGHMMNIVNSVNSQKVEVRTLEYASADLLLRLKRRGFA